MSLLFFLPSDIVVPDEPPTLTPTLPEVGALLHARTRSDETGEELGTFTDHTRPTGLQVEGFIADALTEIMPRLPVDLDADLVPIARRLAAIRAAMFSEVSLQPDSDATEGSAYDRLEKLYDAGWANLLDIIADRGDSVAPRVRVGSAQLASPFAAQPSPLEALELPLP